MPKGPLGLNDPHCLPFQLGWLSPNLGQECSRPTKEATLCVWVTWPPASDSGLSSTP